MQDDRSVVIVVCDAITHHDDLDDGGEGCVYVDNVLAGDVESQTHLNYPPPVRCCSQQFDLYSRNKCIFFVLLLNTCCGTKPENNLISLC